jgi:hypothetical protein
VSRGGPRPSPPPWPWRDRLEVMNGLRGGMEDCGFDFENAVTGGSNDAAEFDVVTWDRVERVEALRGGGARNSAGGGCR